MEVVPLAMTWIVWIERNRRAFKGVELYSSMALVQSERSCKPYVYSALSFNKNNLNVTLTR